MALTRRHWAGLGYRYRYCDRYRGLGWAGLGRDVWAVRTYKQRLSYQTIQKEHQKNCNQQALRIICQKTPNDFS